jgi:hypothetical protein
LELEDAQNQYTPHVLDLLLGLLQVVATMHSRAGLAIKNSRQLHTGRLSISVHGVVKKKNLCAWHADDITPYMTVST